MPSFRKILIQLLISFALYGLISAQEYSVQTIPDYLKSSAKAVIRNKETTLELLSENRARMTETLAITILNQKGIESSYFVQAYNKFIKVKNISGSIYNADGKRIRKIKPNEIRDYSNISNFSIFEDTRVKFINPNQIKTPFTFEYSYEVVFDGILDYPDFYLVPDYNISVEHALFTLRSKLNDGFRYREVNIPGFCKAQADNNNISWSFSNLKPRLQEFLSPSFIEISPHILIAPNSFRMENRKGNSSNWKDFGKWIYELNDGLNVLEEESVVKIKSLIKDETDTLEIIRILYEYMQSKTRYVSIQIGIGGWQPFPAETVDRLGYGDCKALTNYMKSLCDVAGIPSYYTLVHAGKNGQHLVSDFPCSQFNHAILCVPLPSDTLWLECTSQRIPCGITSTFTDDRDVLIITKEGGKLAHTLRLTADKNKQQRVCHVNIDEEGNGVAEVNSLCTGEKYEFLSRMMNEDDTDQRKHVLSEILIPNFDLLDYDLIENRNMSPNITESLNLNLKHYAKFVGEKMLIRLNLMTTAESIPFENHQRQSDICIPRPYNETDSVYYSIPENYRVNKLPNDKSIVTSFGTYSTSVKLLDNGFLYFRKMELFKGDFPPDEYNEYIDFTEQIARADQQKISLVKTSR